MHGICHGIARQLWQLFSGHYKGTEQNPFCLPKATLHVISEAIPQNKYLIPTIAAGDSWRNVDLHGGYMRTVDWSDFLLYIVPTLVAEDHIKDQEAKEALIYLAYACKILQSWNISARQLEQVKT